MFECSGRPVKRVDGSTLAQYRRMLMAMPPAEARVVIRAAAKWAATITQIQAISQSAKQVAGVV